MNYPEALVWLYATQERGIKLGLDRMRDYLARLGWTGEGARFLHVAGTNGKGSVCAMLDSICRGAGYRTGLFTSPHLVTFRERIRMEGEMAAPETIAVELTRIRNVCKDAAFEPTFFEITTALALMLFQTHRMEIAVLETGLGGRLDSTNVVTPEVSVITSIGMDHMNLLGSTLAEIAREKAGIIKPGVPVVTGPLPREAAAVVAQVALERAAPLTVVTEPRGGIRPRLPGSHQLLNATLAERALAAAGLEISPVEIEQGLRAVAWPGRFQRCGGRFILDGAHNPDAARTLAQTWREEFGSARARIILGILQDKDAAGICAELAPIAERFIIVPVRSPRNTPPAQLLEVASRYAPGQSCASLAGAMDHADPASTPALICGSLFLVGEALCLLGLAAGEPEISAQ